MDSETKALLDSLVEDISAILSEKSSDTYHPDTLLATRLARSPHEGLAGGVLSSLSDEDLIVLIGSYGLNFNVAKMILSQLDKSDLFEVASDTNYVKHLTDILTSNGISVDQFVEIIMIYSSMDITGSEKLLNYFSYNNK